MAYKLSEAKDPLNIAEREYASRQNKIQFTAITSCIGVVAKKGAKLTGVHLSMLDDKDKYFGADPKNDVANVLKQLPNPADQVTIFGWIEDWRNAKHSNDTVAAAYLDLTGQLKGRVGKGLKLYHEGMRVDGTYSAEIDGDGILITKVV